MLNECQKCKWIQMDNFEMSKSKQSWRNPRRFRLDSVFSLLQKGTVCHVDSVCFHLIFQLVASVTLNSTSNYCTMRNDLFALLNMTVENVMASVACLTGLHVPPIDKVCISFVYIMSSVRPQQRQHHTNRTQSVCVCPSLCM